MVQIQFSTDNAAFEGCEKEESARILRDIADKLESGEECGVILDINGNLIGSFGRE